MAIATYPFFGKVAELMGRLSAPQGDCSSAEVHRRMSEIYGEREGIYRMTNMVLQSQASWQAIERIEKGRRLIRKAGLKNTRERLESLYGDQFIFTVENNQPGVRNYIEIPVQYSLVK